MTGNPDGLEGMIEMTTRAEWIKGLRDMADWFESNPDFPVPKYTGIMVDLFDYNFVGETAVQRMANAARGLGRCEKCHVGDRYYVLRRHFGPHRIDVNTYSENVCSRIQVGTKTVTRPVKLKNPEMETVEEPVYEWHCDPLLANEEAG